MNPEDLIPAPRATCSRRYCAALAAWQPILVLRAPLELYPKAPPAPALLSLGFCHAHRMKLDEEGASALISDEGWAQIVAMFRSARRVEPERGATTLDWKRLER